MDIWLIGGMALLTFYTRYLPFALARKLAFASRWQSLSSYISIAMLSAIVARTTLVREQSLQLDLSNPLLPAALAALVCHVSRLSAWFSTLLGLLVFLLCR